MSDMNLPSNMVLTPDKMEQDPSNVSPQVGPTNAVSEPAEPSAPQQATMAPASSQAGRPVQNRTPPPPTLAGRIIWYIGGAISILLAFRFVLALLGANPASAFAHFIYNVTTPLVSPFFGLFGYTPTYGVSRLEVFTLVAIAVYALVAWGLVKLVTITRPEGQ